MADKRHSVLIIAQSGQLRNGLQVLLTSVSRLNVLAPVESSQAALAQIESQPPTSVLIEFDPANSPGLLGQIKTAWPHIYCVVLVDSLWQQQAAKTAGADVTLRQGIAPADILTTFEKLAHPPVK